MSLQAVFFDMGGTIETFRFTRELRVERSSVIIDCLSRAGISLALTKEEFAEKITAGAKAYNHWNMQTHIELPAEEIWSKFYLQGFDVSTERLKPISEKLSFLYETQLFIREMRPEIPSVLKKIRDFGLTIGCISNTQSTTQVPNTLEKYGIDEFFEHVVLSSSYGRRKPDPAIFYYAARLAKLPTRSCMYVGDKINRDILGSKAAGYCLSVKIQHPYDNGEVDEGAIPDAIIDNMTALIPIIENALEHKKSFSSVPMTSEIKALFFDAGDVLYYRPRKNEHLKAFLKGKNLCPASNIEEEKQRLKNLAFLGQIKRHDYYSQVIHLFGIEDPQEIKAGVQAIEEDDNTVEIYDGVPETIMELKKRGFLLGIITDTAMPFSKKLKWFDDYGFGDVWDVMISSRDIGLRKPEPKMYELAIQQTCIEPSEAIFVGHKKSELEGAKCVGMKTIAINYDEDAPADYYINCFSELLNLSCIQKK